MTEEIIGLSPQSLFAFERNLGELRKRMQKALDFYLTATESDSKSDKVETSTFDVDRPKRAQNL